MASLDGTWIYRSFCPNGGSPSLVPWSPPGKLSVTTDATGKVDGKLKFKLPSGELELTVSGSITPPVAGSPPLPEGVELMGRVGEGDRESVNELRGYFVAGGASPVIVGTIVAVKNDPLRKPPGTSGPFVLVPATTNS